LSFIGSKLAGIIRAETLSQEIQTKLWWHFQRSSSKIVAGTVEVDSFLKQKKSIWLTKFLSCLWESSYSVFSWVSNCHLEKICVLEKEGKTSFQGKKEMIFC